MADKIYEEGVGSGVYTQGRVIPLRVFHSSEDEGWIVMFDNYGSLSAFGDSPEEALKEFGIMIQGALDSGFKVEQAAERIDAEPRTN